MIRYSRAPSPAFAELLAAGGMGSPLLVSRIVAGIPLDAHFRERDHLHLYRGLTRLVDASLVRGQLRLDAHASYKDQSCATGLFRTWRTTEEGLAGSLKRYLDAVSVDASYSAREGGVQAAWSSIRSPWVPFDREAVLGYSDRSARVAGRAFDAVADAREAVEDIARSNRWAQLPSGKVAAELDQLAVDEAGRLILIEIKYSAATPSSVYYSPFQLLQYVHEWAAAFEHVKTQLETLIEARKVVGLSPLNLARLSGEIRPVVAFGADVPSQSVRDRFDKVREIVNQRLPASALPVEVWAMDGGYPKRLS